MTAPESQASGWGRIASASDLFISPVTFQEISAKNKKHPEKFRFTAAHAQQAFRDLHCRELPYRLEHARQVDCLPIRHSDPFDRILIAQAIVERLTLLSADRRVVQHAGEHQTGDGIARNLSVLVE